MKSVVFLSVGSLLLFSQPAFGGALYGTIRIDQDPAVQVEVVVECPATSGRRRLQVRTRTNARGSFSLQVPARGRCLMGVNAHDVRGDQFEVFVSDNAIRFDVLLDKKLTRVR